MILRSRARLEVQKMLVWAFRKFVEWLLQAIKTKKLMKVFSLIILLALFAPCVNAQMNGGLFTYDDHLIYKGETPGPFNTQFTYRNGVIYKGNSESIINLLYTVENGHLYEGRFVSNQTCKYTITTDAVYSGFGPSIFRKLYTIKDWRIYKGTDAVSYDCLFTITNDGIFRGYSTKEGDRIVFLDDFPDEVVIAFVLDLLKDEQP